MMKKILLVEDDPFIVDIYASQLKGQGYAVDTANTGELALEKIKQNCPDLLLLDLILPGMDGWEVLKSLRQDPRTKALKVFIISNLNQKENADNITNLGVTKYFLKIQTTPEDISNAVKEAIG